MEINETNVTTENGTKVSTFTPNTGKACYVVGGVVGVGLLATAAILVYNKFSKKNAVEDVVEVVSEVAEEVVEKVQDSIEE